MTHAHTTADRSGAAIKVALIQNRASRVVADNLVAIERETRSAAQAGAKVVVFPEASMVNFGPNLDAFAEPLDGPFATRVGEVARECGIIVVVGMFTPDPGDPTHVFNTVLVTGRDVHAGYNKIHLYDSFGTTESEHTSAGNLPLTFDVDGVRLGIATCFDIRFPGLFYALADAGAHAVLVPTNWAIGDGKEYSWDLLVRSRALDSTMWVLGCDQPGGNRIIPFGVGLTTVVEPGGTTIEQLGNEAGRIIAEVTTERVDEVRQDLPLLELRREFGEVRSL